MTVRIALLGAGFVSTFYLQGLAEVPDQQVSIVYSRSIERARICADRWGIPDITTDMRAAVARPDIDLVIIGLPNQVHMEAVLLAAEHRKAVVCTKPLGRTPQEARAMLEAVRRAGIVHGYAETEVFSPAVVRARALIEAGALGKVLTVRSREAHAGPHAPQFWDRALTGGGALMDMGCHTIEAARYFIGKEVQPVETLAWGARLVHHDRTEAEDNAVMLLRFAGDQLAHMELSWTARGGLDLRNEVYGTHGAAFTDVTRSTPIRAFTLGGAGYLMEKAEAEAGWVFPIPDEARVYGYHAEMQHFVECASTHTMPRETFEDGYIVNVILEAAYRSMQSKRWEPITL